MAEAYKLLRDPPPRKLAFIDTGQGVSCNPDAADAELRNQWGFIYDGNIPRAELWSQAHTLTQAYEPFIYTSAPFELPEISAQDVQHAFRTRATSAGPDAWSLDLLRHSTLKAAQWVALLYGAIEK